MIKCETVTEFTLKDFKKLKNVERKDEEKQEEGRLFVGDTFECDEEMAKYLTGNNIINAKVVNIIEILPQKNESTEKAKDKKRKKEN